MENEPKETVANTFQKSRSASGCITEGFRLYATSLKWVVRASWPVALLYAAVWSVLTMSLTSHLPLLKSVAMAGIDTSSMGIDLVASWPIVALFLASVLLELGVYASAMWMLGQQVTMGQKAPKPRKWWSPVVSGYLPTLNAALLCVAVAIAIVMVLAAIVLLPMRLIPAAGQGSTVHTIAVAVVCMVGALSTLPLWLTFFGYALDGGSPWKKLKTGYAIGMRRYGFVFIVMLATLMVIGVAHVVLALPAVVLGIANLQANLGILYGDDPNMPSYVAPVSAAVFFLAGFVQVYIRLSAIFTGTFMHGALQAHEAERKSFATQHPEANATYQ